MLGRAKDVSHSARTDTTEGSAQNCGTAQLITAHFVTHFRASCTQRPPCTSWVKPFLRILSCIRVSPSRKHCYQLFKRISFTWKTFTMSWCPRRFPRKKSCGHVRLRPWRYERRWPVPGACGQNQGWQLSHQAHACTRFHRSFLLFSTVDDS